MVNYSIVLKISTIISIVIIIFSLISWIFPALLPKDYYLNVFMAISAASAILNLAKLKKGASFEDVTKALGAHDLKVAIENAKQTRSSDDYEELFESIKGVEKTLREYLEENVDD